MLEKGQKVGERRRVVQLFPEDFKHGRGTLGVDVNLVVSLGQLFLVVVANHFEKVQVSVESLVLVLPQLVDGRLDAQHQQLVTEVEPELQVLLAGTVVEDGVEKRHDGRLEVDVVPVLARAPVQVVEDALKPSALARKCLQMISLYVCVLLATSPYSANHVPHLARDM